ncbi:unnamed protein product [Mesocestoides corti]|uniref:C2H2-type domain-containing protein n=1 Tax=Mesocestoides corti TaxID=53468 RepID=A0A0R3UGN3_MESCO|nr:unnamed protein product [Mesocestoides corti]
MRKRPLECDTCKAFLNHNNRNQPALHVGDQSKGRGSRYVTQGLRATNTDLRGQGGGRGSVCPDATKRDTSYCQDGKCAIRFLTGSKKSKGPQSSFRKKIKLTDDSRLTETTFAGKTLRGGFHPVAWALGGGVSEADASDLPGGASSPLLTTCWFCLHQGNP